MEYFASILRVIKWAQVLFSMRCRIMRNERSQPENQDTHCTWFFDMTCFSTYPLKHTLVGRRVLAECLDGLYILVIVEVVVSRRTLHSSLVQRSTFPDESVLPEPYASRGTAWRLTK